MSIPGFNAAASLPESTRNYRKRASATQPEDSPIEMQAISHGFRGLRGFGGFGPTLPSCHWELQWVVCGSALPGYDVPMCQEWVYVCTFPGSSGGILM
jgi:hypothetical protein